jgi:hypothetical protein
MTRPRRGNVEVKFTFERRSRTALTVVIRSPHTGHLTGDSSVYSASNFFSGVEIS